MSPSQRTISLAVLAVLTALPVSAAVCAIRCDSAARAATSTHHASGKGCEEPARTFTETRIQRSGHQCMGHDVVVHQTATTAAGRADLAAAADPLAASIGQTTSATLTGFRQVGGYHSPPGTAPPTTTPVVLRV